VLRVPSTVGLPRVAAITVAIAVAVAIVGVGGAAFSLGTLVDGEGLKPQDS